MKAKDEAPLARVAIAISAFRSDAAILNLLGKIYSEGGHDAAAVIVVDSLNEGGLEAEIRRRGWPVKYENARTNLGSAGNLARRLELAAQEEADWCFAVNHDGMFDRVMVEALLKTGQTSTRIGAVFPKRIFTDRKEGKVLTPHRSIFGLPRFQSEDGPSAARDEVAWDSSNGALYHLQPVRRGLKPWADLWSGWEDLAYGWLLSQEGWKQLYAPEAEYFDDYEYQPVSLLGKTFSIVRKPPWHAYYVVRNLFLIIKRTRPGPRGWFFLLVRVVRETAFAILFRNQKAARLRAIAHAVLDGFRGVTGQWRGM